MNTQTNITTNSLPLWIGLADVEPTDCCDLFNGDKIAGAVTHVVAYAGSSIEFTRVAHETLAAINLSMLSIESVQLVTERERTIGLSNELEELVMHVKETMRPGVGTFYPYDE